MIFIKEDKTKHIPGITALFVSFIYRPEYVEIIKQCDCYYFNKKDKIWEVPVTDLSRLLDKFCMFDEITFEPYRKQGFEKIDNNVELSINEYKTKPFLHQEEAIRFGLTHDNFLLLDAPGLGKTLSMIYLAQELKKKENINHCLIICGVNSLKINWKNEINRHSDLSCRILGQRITRKNSVKYGGNVEKVEDLKTELNEFFIIVNVEALRHAKVLEYLQKGPNKFDMIVLDEAHKCKSPTASQAKGLLKLKAQHKIALTGTPLLNSPMDALMPLKWIGFENSSKSTFEHYYVKKNGYQFLGYRNMELLKYQFSLCSLRRGKDLLNLPAKTIIDEWLEMEDDQKSFYNNLINGIKTQVDLVQISNANLLSMVTRLRQATAFPGILSSENISSCKIDRACDLCEQIISGGDKVVVYSTFKDTVTELNKRLQKYNPLICTGDVKESDIEAAYKEFQNNPNNKLLLATWQKMGTGFTLTAASYAIFVDCSWTFGDNLQAEDRLNRIGSKNPVFIYYLWCKDSIDELVKQAVQRKEIVSDYIIDGKIDPSTIQALRKYIQEIGNS